MHQQMQTAASIAIVITLSVITSATVTNSPCCCPVTVLVCQWPLLASLNIAYDLYFLNLPFPFSGSGEWSLFDSQDPLKVYTFHKKATFSPAPVGSVGSLSTGAIGC